MCDGGEDLVGTPRQVVDAVVLVEIGDGDLSRRRRADTSVTRAPSASSTGAVSVDDTARHFGLAGRDPAGLAVLLHAEVDRLAPLVVLVVVVAARVEAEVAAERAHVAQVRRRDLRRGLPQRAVRLADARVAHELGQRDAGADASEFAVRPAAAARRSSSMRRRPISVGGTCWRRFMFGSRSVPPATSIAPPGAASSSAASRTVRGAWYGSAAAASWRAPPQLRAP